MSATAVTDVTFEADVLRAPLPVLVDFWTPGCASCRALAPLVDELATEYAGRVRIVKVDADASRASAVRLGVRGVPNFVLLKDGRVVQQILGAVPRSRLVRAIEDLLRA